MKNFYLKPEFLSSMKTYLGSKFVKDLVARFSDPEPPFRLSSAFPSGMLPMPVLPGIPREKFRKRFAGNQSSGTALFEMLEEFKTFRKKQFITTTAWQKLRNTLNSENLFAEFTK